MGTMLQRKYLVSYCDGDWKSAQRRLTREAIATGEFDGVFQFGHDDVSQTVRTCPAFAIPRGAGLWSWKPDIILKALERIDAGDILVYCDAGCTLKPSRAWKQIWKILDKKDLFAQRLYRRMDHWSRVELMREFSDVDFTGLYQFMATLLVMTKSNFTVDFMNEWKRYMVERLELYADVSPEVRNSQHREFIESRHDQSVFSALLYRSLLNPASRQRIAARWESCENRNLVFPQPIRATRWRGEEPASASFGKECSNIVRRFLKDYVYRPLVASPSQWKAEHRNGMR